MSALSAMQDKTQHLENSLSAETRIKLDLFSALGDAKRQLEIAQGRRTAGPPGRVWLRMHKDERAYPFSPQWVKRPAYSFAELENCRVTQRCWCSSTYRVCGNMERGGDEASLGSQRAQGSWCLSWVLNDEKGLAQWRSSSAEWGLERHITEAAAWARPGKLGGLMCSELQLAVLGWRRLQSKWWEESLENWLFTQQAFIKTYCVPGIVRIPEGPDSNKHFGLRDPFTLLKSLSTPKMFL